MGEVRRYETLTDHGMRRCDHGPWVMHSDYARLERERDAAVSAADEFSAMIAEAKVELTRLRAVEKAANAYVESIRQCLDPEDPPELLALAEACGRRG